MNHGTDNSQEGALSRLLDPVFKLCAFAASLALFAMLAIMAAEIILRSLSLGTLIIADEASAGLLVATTFLGLSAAIREGSLFRFDGIASRIPAHLADYYERLLYLIALATSSIMFWYLSALVYSTYQRGTISDGMIGYPLWIPQVLMPIGMAMVVFALLEKLISPTTASPGGQTHV